MTVRISKDVLHAILKRYRGTTREELRRRKKGVRLHDLLELTPAWRPGGLDLMDRDGVPVVIGADAPDPDIEGLRTHVEIWCEAGALCEPTGDVVRDAGRALLHDFGIDPVRAHELGSALGEAKWLDEAGFAAVERASGTFRSVRMLSDRIFWLDGQLTMIGHSMTATMHNAYVGGALSALISHPVLDAHHLTVQSVDRICISGSGGRASMVVKVS